MSQLRAWLQLCRFGNVFTALADIFLGYLLTHSRLNDPADIGRLLVASAGLYLSGMVFNDVFDLETDRRERPERPLPSGRISRRAAIYFGLALMLSGVAAAAWAGFQSLLMAVLLTVCILGYDGFLKKTPIGPLGMGACRFLNVLLGASTAGLGWWGDARDVWRVPQLAVAAALGTYITGVTWFARGEAARSRRPWLIGAALLADVGLGMLMAFVATWPDDLSRHRQTLILIGTVALLINRRMVLAIWQPTPARVQAAIKTMLLSLVTLDAAIVYFVRDPLMYAVGVVCLLLPALLISRWIRMT